MKVWRFVGFDDCFDQRKAYIVGCVTAGTYVEGFLIDEIAVDGLDVTEKIINAIRRSRFGIQLRCIFLDGITFAGFNVVDVDELYDTTGIPVIVLVRKYPNFEDIERALRNLSDYERRWELIKRAGKIYEVEGSLVQLRGCNIDTAKLYLRASRLKGKVPEPLRIAHLVASALIHGESRKR